MAKNPPAGDGHRIGAVKNRTQTFNGRVDRWIKRNDDSGRFMDQKQDGKPFKGVEREKGSRDVDSRRPGASYSG